MAKIIKKRYKLGTIIAIPLDGEDIPKIDIQNGHYGYARFYENGYLGVYKKITYGVIKNTEELLGVKIAFHYYTEDKSVQNGLWPIIGEYVFQATEDTFAPPTATCYSKILKNWSQGGPKIIYKDDIYNSTEEKTKDMDLWSLPDNHFLKFIMVDRLVNGNHANYKVGS
jgi:hypothetical protein